ncbi:hypothetical protein JOC61_000086 [Marinitoga litoralis]|nr:hypothetical protein [Marinitoga litoralis]
MKNEYLLRNIKLNTLNNQPEPKVWSLKHLKFGLLLLL